MTIVDGTFGRGGHAMAFRDAGARVIAFDRDPDAVAFGRSQGMDVTHGRFSEHAPRVVDTPVDAVLLDLGVCSTQIDTAERGFSFQHDGPLDARFCPDSQEITAADVVNGLNEAALRQVLYRGGVEKEADAIAIALAERRDRQLFTRTKDLADVVFAAALTLQPKRFARKKKVDEAFGVVRRVFQALRIEVNGEREELDMALRVATNCLAPGGRLAVLSFHSLEHDAVRTFLDTYSGRELAKERRRYEAVLMQKNPMMDATDLLDAMESKGAFGLRHPKLFEGRVPRSRPTSADIQENPRAKSAMLTTAIRSSHPKIDFNAP